MSRLGKQLVYGSFFVLILLVLVAGVYFLFFRSGPSCANGKQDRGEEGVDCGGVCPTICLPPGITPLEVVVEPRLFRPTPRLVGVLVKIQNPNLEFAAPDFDYRLEIYNIADEILASRVGKSFIYAGEIKYLVEFVEVSDSRDAVRASFTAKNREWLPAANYSRPLLVLQEQKAEIGEDSALIASGRLLNQDVVDFPRVEVVALFHGSSGAIVGISKTEVDNVEAGEARTFHLIYPAAGSIEPQKTEYFIYARRP